MIVCVHISNNLNTDASLCCCFQNTENKEFPQNAQHYASSKVEKHILPQTSQKSLSLTCLRVFWAYNHSFSLSAFTCQVMYSYCLGNGIINSC